MNTPAIHWTDQSPTALDALLADRQGAWWDAFYADRARPVPFFCSAPDESLVAWVEAGHIRPGHALDLGCGTGRNAVYLARAGFDVDAVDYSHEAVAWATQRAAEADVAMRLHQASVFDVPITPGSMDLVVDGGCFHHLAPHRRDDYIALVAGALKPGGQLAMTCFRPEGGSGLSDEQVYERRTLAGGLGYTEAQLRALWSGALDIIELRPMHAQPEGGPLFGLPFLWVMRARKA